MHNRLDSALTPNFTMQTMGQTGYSSPTAAFPKTTQNQSKQNLSVISEVPTKNAALAYIDKPGTISKQNLKQIWQLKVRDIWFQLDKAKNAECKNVENEIKQAQKILFKIKDEN